MKAKRVDNGLIYEVRKMSDDEMDNTHGQHFCSDETGHIFKEEDLIFIQEV